MASLATVAQLETRLGVLPGSLSGPDLARAQSALDDASELVKKAGLPSWTESTGADPAPPIAVVVTLRLAKRVYQNPEDNRWEQLGDYTRGKSDPTSLLTSDEIALVQQAAGFSYGVYSIQTPA